MKTNFPMFDLFTLAQQTGHALQSRHWLLATAESCTGGAVATAMTEIDGSSAWFERGFITYTNQAKQDMLGVAATTLLDFGAVSEETALEMAVGALAHSQAHIVVAITGIAGPTGGSKEKPVGTVWIAFATKLITQTHAYCFTGDRHSIRMQSVQQALTGIIQLCRTPV